VWYQVPAEATQPYPIVLVHGGGGQGTDWLSTPDGRPGWATRLVQLGFPTYVLDRAGLGRSPYSVELYGPSTPVPTYEYISGRFTAAPRSGRWPGTGELGDAALDHLVASMGPSIADFARTHALMGRAAAELAERIGPMIIITHSMGAPFGWLAAERCPGMVRALVALEPLGPAFARLPGGSALDWGLTAIPMTYDPPASDPAELRLEAWHQPGNGAAEFFVQREPARKLRHLAGLPIAVVTSGRSLMAPTDAGTVAFLSQAGADVTHLRLEDLGLTGNGHLMMLEENSDAVLEVVTTWLTATLGRPR
jgi:pimeloyl-ACP methyl ester carboxylesterase